MSKTVAYYRSSTDLQEHSIGMQRHSAFICSLKNGLLVEKEYVDEAVSALLVPMEKRPKMKELIKDIESGTVGTIVVYKRDRFARRSVEYLKFYNLLKQYRINVVFASSDEMPMKYTPIGEYLENIMSGFIQMSAEQIKKNILASKIANFQKGDYFGSIPYGYRIDKEKGEIVRNEVELKNIRFFYDEVLNERHNTFNDLHKYLIEQKITKEGKAFTAQNLYKLITHPLFQGDHVMSFGGEKYTNRYEYLAIVSFEEWNRAQEIASRMSTKRIKKEKVEITFLAEGLLFCKTCGRNLVPKIRQRSGREIGMYECSEHEIKVEKGKIEQLIFERAKDMFSLLVKSNYQSLLNRYQKEHDQKMKVILNRQNKKIEDLEVAIDQWTEKYLLERNGDKKVEIKNKIMHLHGQKSEEVNTKEELEEQRIKLTSKLQHGESLTATLFKYPDFIDQQENDTLIQLLRDIVYKVTVNEYCIHIDFKHPFMTSAEVLEDATI